MTDSKSKKEYSKLVDRKNPKSKCFTDCVKAFFIGGVICLVGQCFLSFYQTLELSEEMTSAATSISMVFLGVLLTGLDIYPKIAKHGGAGTLVPITGFANAVAAPAIEAKTEGYILGVGTKIFTIAGPVILFGEIASFIAGIIFWIMKL